MDLKLTEEQTILRDMVRSMVEDHSTTELVRQMEHDANGVPATLWQQMKDMGLLGITLPEEYGGIGLDMINNPFDQRVPQAIVNRPVAPLG